MILIGENLNIISQTIGPALKGREPKVIQDMARAETEAGVDYIDLNIGPARRGGDELMDWVVKTVQEVTDKNLALDTTNLQAMEAGLNFIRLATPTTDEKRLPAVLANTSGFVYYVSIAGITGTAAPDAGAVHRQVAHIKGATVLPVAVGFGVRTPEQAKAISQGADGVVVGSALVSAIAGSLTSEGKATPATVPAVLDLVGSLSRGLKGA